MALEPAAVGKVHRHDVVSEASARIDRILGSSELAQQAITTDYSHLSPHIGGDQQIVYEIPLFGIDLSEFEHDQLKWFYLGLGWHSFKHRIIRSFSSDTPAILTLFYLIRDTAEEKKDE